MLFSSQLFILLFLPVTLCCYYCVGRSKVWRLRVLLIASLLFYGYWDLRFVPLLLGSLGANWLLAAWFKQRGLGVSIALGIGVNLALLGVVKYADFFASAALAVVGQTHEPWAFILPLGISFFTFQQISYLVDLRRGSAPVYQLQEYAAYVTFFPQLIAGPIVRHNQLIPQFEESPMRSDLHERLSRGAVLCTLGLVKKVYFADELAPVANAGFDAVLGGETLSAAGAWVASLAYTLQLYFDFSSYSDMAIGLALMFGFVLPINFDNPYRAVNIREFWRRWHITLSSFLRDYVYIPLGGSRQGAIAVAATVLTTMLLCGLWHGAGWTFVVWGAAHGIAIIVSRSWSAMGGKLPAMLGWLLTLLFVVAGWVLFRAENFTVAAEMLASMAGLHGWSEAPLDADDVLYVLIGSVVALVGLTNVEISQRHWLAQRGVAIAAAVALVAVVLRVGYGRSLEFIYFQF